MTLRIAALLVAVLACDTRALAQDARVSLPRMERREFTSKVNGREYSVLVSLPRDYPQNAGARFPVVYLTDANWTFAMTVQTQVLLRTGAMTPDMIFEGEQHLSTFPVAVTRGLRAVFAEAPKR